MPETALESLRRIEKEERGKTHEGTQDFFMCLVEGIVELADRVFALDNRIEAFEKAAAGAHKLPDETWTEGYPRRQT